MVISYDIDAAARLVWLRYHGEAPDATEWQTMVEAVLKDPGVKPGFNFLLDGLAIPMTHATPFHEHILAFLALHQTKGEDCRIAIVVSDNATFGMGQHTEALMKSKGSMIKCFDSIEAARTWLMVGDAIAPVAAPVA